LAKLHPRKLAFISEFSERLAHQIEAGADMFLMPSRYEPCGLNQMYSQRYATPPIVHATGGLADSVINCTDATLKNRSASGFTFHHFNPAELLATIQHAILLYRDTVSWREIQKNGMAKNFSWNASAQRYLDVYKSLLK
jgi:starch synthase